MNSLGEGLTTNQEKTMKRVVCFDLWNTLAHSLAGVSYQDLLVKHGAKKGLLYPFVRDCLMTRILTYEQMVERIVRFFRLSCSKEEQRQVVACWQAENNCVAWIDSATNVLKWCRADRDTIVVLVSNCTERGWQSATEQLDLLKYFDLTIASCHNGCAKPDYRIWEMIRAFYPKTGEFWMIGDNATDDLAVPKALGWKTILVGPRGVALSEVPTILKGDRK
jgi:FMN phosphatase YigB (HAD superfamily)